MEKIAIKCTNKQQWDNVQSHYGKDNEYLSSSEGHIELGTGDYWITSTEFQIKLSGFTIISYQQFEEQYLKPKEIKFQEGKWYTIPRTHKKS